MKYFLWVFILSALASHGQTHQPAAYAVVDTSKLAAVIRWGQHVQLSALSTLPDQRHVRLFTAGCVLDFWQAASGGYQGQVVQWVREVVPDKEPATKREFVLSQLLAASTAQALFTMLDSCQVLLLPDEQVISGWQRNFIHGISYTLEYRDGQTYRVATYSNPASQGSLLEAQRVTRFIQRLTEISQLRELTQVFERAIPYEGFADDRGLSTIRFSSYSQHLAYRRDRDRYRRQQRQVLLRSKL